LLQPGAPGVLQLSQLRDILWQPESLGSRSQILHLPPIIIVDQPRGGSFFRVYRFQIILESEITHRHGVSRRFYRHFITQRVPQNLFLVSRDRRRAFPAIDQFAFAGSRGPSPRNMVLRLRAERLLFAFEAAVDLGHQDVLNSFLRAAHPAEIVRQLLRVRRVNRFERALGSGFPGISDGWRDLQSNSVPLISKGCLSVFCSGCS
jgi:hypothetical protein